MPGYLLGYDLGSSSIKAALIEPENGTLIASAFSPETELPIHSHRPDWAEQDPDSWWKNVQLATKEMISPRSGFPIRCTV